MFQAGNCPSGHGPVLFRVDGTMKHACTGVILAGGLNSRFSGKEKAFLRIGEKCFIERVLDVFSGIFQEIILVTNNAVAHLQWDVRIVADIYPFRSSLTGLHAGLFYAEHPYAFFTACDTPFLQRELVESLVEAIDPRFDIVLPETEKGLEPLCAVYSRKCLKPIQEQLDRKDLQVRKIYEHMKVKKLSEEFLREKDPLLLSLVNVNTPEELAGAEALAARHGLV